MTTESPVTAMTTIDFADLEATPFDGVKYEVDKRTGYLKVDRPQGSSSLPPMRTAGISSPAAPPTSSRGASAPTGR